MMARLLELTRARHAKYGDTLFHLEPNIKDCPGGLRDVHVCGWMTTLREVRSGSKKGKGRSVLRYRRRRASEFRQGGGVSVAGAVLSALSA